MPFLNTCISGAQAEVSSVFLSVLNKPALEAPEAEVAGTPIHVMLIVLHTGKDEGIQQELDYWKQQQLAIGKHRLDILVLAGGALMHHLSALASGPDLFRSRAT